MLHTRFSTPADVPVQRELWKLAFGDTDEYLDNFYLSYYRPERAIVLEENGVVRAMTTWFDTTLTLPNGKTYRAAYLYAVATHPDCRGRGLAGKLLADTGELLRPLGIDLLTTVPAEPSLHNFFGSNGFEEGFVMDERQISSPQSDQENGLLIPATPTHYNKVREALLSGVPHITFPDEAMAHQLRCCTISGGGGLFVGMSQSGPVCLCAERADDHLLVVKEILGCENAQQAALDDLAAKNSCKTLLIRSVLGPKPVNPVRFGMLKWLICTNTVDCGDLKNAFLGLAFD